jgi:dimethylargininase
MRFRRAIVRRIPDSFVRAVREHAAVPIDMERARTQHAAYVSALRGAGLDLIDLPPLDRHPDCCFVEDTAVVVGEVALATRPGHASRRGEVDSIAQLLSLFLGRLERMTEPAQLDGGDCLRVGQRLFVGRSGRSNPEGIAKLRATFEPAGVEVVEVPVAGLLHLKCACSPIDDRRVLLAEESLPAVAFPGLEVVPVPRQEAYAANCLCVNGVALVPAGHERTARLLEREGLRVVPLEMSEARKADGALTCQSILLE